MVVAGLQEYLLNSSQLRGVSLSLLADQIQRETGKQPKLVFQFSTIKQWVWSVPSNLLRGVGDYPDYTAVCGPDLHLVADRTRCFVRAMRSLGVIPVIFVDVTRHSLVEEDVLLVQQMLEGSMAPVLHTIGPGMLAERQILLSLREEGATLNFSFSPLTLQRMARYLKNHEEICGIVSGEADFAMVSGCVLFPRQLFDGDGILGLMEGVQVDGEPRGFYAAAISSVGLAESLGIHEDQLPELAVLCGTERTRPFLKRLAVLTSLGIKGSDIDDIADWLKERESPLLEDPVMRNLCMLHPEFLDAIQKTYSAFTALEPASPVDSSSSPLPPVDRPLDSNMMENSRLSAIALGFGGIDLPILMESLTLGRPSMLELLCSFRRMLYILVGVSRVCEIGRTATQTCMRQEISVCASEEESKGAVQKLKLLQGLEQSQKLAVIYNLSISDTELSISSLFDAIDNLAKASPNFPKLEEKKLCKLAILCCSFRLLVLLNKSSFLSISEEEMGALVVASLTCATETEILPHIVHVLPSMKAVSIAEWFSTVIDYIYQMAGLVGLTGTPEPCNVFYPMAYIPYHLTFEQSSSNLSTVQITDIEYIKTALRLALSLPSVAKFTSTLLNAAEYQSLPDLVSLCNAALDEVLGHTEQLLPRTMTAPLSVLLSEQTKRENEETSDEEEDEKKEEEEEEEARVWDKEELPIMEHREKIIGLIENYQVVCIEGETGCGKSSQVPQFILQHFPNSTVFVSQPNSLAARKLAERVVEEGNLPDRVVTHSNELRSKENNADLIYGTNAYLIQALLESDNSSQYTHIILDEIHERSIDIDFGMYLVRRLAVRLPELKIVLMSATLQGTLFVDYFRKMLGGAENDRVSDPYFVGVRRFPVKVVFIDELTRLVTKRRDSIQAAAMTELVRLQKNLEDDGDNILSYSAEVNAFTQEVCINLILAIPGPQQTVIVFLPGMSDIIDLRDLLLKKLQREGVRDRFKIHVFHRMVPMEEEKAAFEKPPTDQAYVILSTNIVESSLTIPHLTLVIDFAARFYMVYDPRTKTSKLSRRWCSKASCTQRAGRVGRLSPGTAVHLIRREDHRKLPDFNLPDIVSSPLSKTVLKAKRLIKKGCGVTRPSQLLGELIEPPSILQFEAALEELTNIGAILYEKQGLSISEETDMTLLGEFSANIPLDLFLCHLILLGILLGCPNDVVIIAAGLSMYQDVFTLPTKLVMEDMHKFCESLSRSTFSRLSHDAGCYSTPMMIRNMFLEWLKFAHQETGSDRRRVANKFSFRHAVRVKRLLKLEISVSDLAGVIYKLLPPGTKACIELKALSMALSQMDRTRPPGPEFCSNKYFIVENEHLSSPSPQVSLRPNTNKYVPPHLRNLSRHHIQSTLRQIHFCDNNLLLKTLITAASSNRILLGERLCDSSHPETRTLARRCLQLAKEEEFRPSTTLAMDVYPDDELDLWAEDLRETNEATITELYSSLPRQFRFPVKVQFDKEESAAVINFSETAEGARTVATIAGNFGYCVEGSGVVDKSCTAELSPVSLSLQMIWRFGEHKNVLGNFGIESVNALFTDPIHPNQFAWSMLSREQLSLVTSLYNFRNPTAFMCQFKEPAHPYLAVTSGFSDATVTSNVTLLPPPPLSFVMILAFQLPTSLTELLIDRKEKKVRGLRLNKNDIPCRDIDKYLTIHTLTAINKFRACLSNILSLSPQDGYIPLSNSELNESLVILLSSHSTTTPDSVDTISPVPPEEAVEDEEEEEREGEEVNSGSDIPNLVWERITPGRLYLDKDTDIRGLYYPELRCSLLGTLPYAESASHGNTASDLSVPPPVQYKESLSTKLLIENFEIVTESEDEDYDDVKLVEGEKHWRTSSRKKQKPRSLDKGSDRDGGTAEGDLSTLNQENESVPQNIQYLLAKLEQELVRHLQRNNKMEFLSELRVQRRIKKICSLLKITLNVPFFLKRPGVFQVKELEEEEEEQGEEKKRGAGEEKDYLILLVKSQWRDVDSEEEESVLTPSMKFINRAKRLHRQHQHNMVTEGTQTELASTDSSRPSSAGDTTPDKKTHSKPLTATKAPKFSNTKPAMPQVPSPPVKEKKPVEPTKTDQATKDGNSSGHFESSEIAKPANKESLKKTLTGAAIKRKAPPPGSDGHLALFAYDYIKKRGGVLKLARVKKDVLHEYYSKYPPNKRYGGYYSLTKHFFLNYPELYGVYKEQDENVVRLVEMRPETKSKHGGTPPVSYDSKAEKKSNKPVKSRESSAVASKVGEGQSSVQKSSSKASTVAEKQLETEKGMKSVSLSERRSPSKTSEGGTLAKTQQGGGGGGGGGRGEKQVFVVHVPNTARRSQEPVAVSDSESFPVAAESTSHKLSQSKQFQEQSHTMLSPPHVDQVKHEEPGPVLPENAASAAITLPKAFVMAPLARPPDANPPIIQPQPVIPLNVGPPALRPPGAGPPGSGPPVPLPTAPGVGPPVPLLAAAAPSLTAVSSVTATQILNPAAMTFSPGHSHIQYPMRVMGPTDPGVRPSGVVPTVGAIPPHVVPPSPVKPTAQPHPPLLPTPPQAAPQAAPQAVAMSPQPPPLPQAKEEPEWHSSEESWLSEDERESEQQPHYGSPEHVVHYLHNYLTSHPYPFGCPLPELNKRYQAEYKKKFDTKKITKITVELLKSYPELFTVRDEMFMRLKDGVNIREDNQSKYHPYTPEHVNDYFTRYLRKTGTPCSMSEAQDIFEKKYKNEYRMPQSPRIWYLSNTFFNRSYYLFVLFTKPVVYIADDEVNE